ncbi:MAG: hypothetical protein P8J32_04255 [bacterium]|nr:hypothetical protein [bacterium]
MRGKKVLNELRLNFGYEKGNNGSRPDYFIRRAKEHPRRVEISREQGDLS